MLTQKKRFIEKYGIALGVLVGIGLLAVVAGPALAQDLSDGVSTATSSFKSIIKTVFSIAAIVIVVGGLVLSAFKFTQRDQHALHYLVGMIAAGAICGIVSGILYGLAVGEGHRTPIYRLLHGAPMLAGIPSAICGGR